MYQHEGRRVFFLLLVLFFLHLFAARPTTVVAQTYSADLSGIVTDPQGGVIPGATVTIRNTATNETRQVITSELGRYTFNQLPPAEYDITAELPGFKTQIQRGVRLQAGQTARMDIRLQIGEMADRVEVSARALRLDTESADQSVTLSNEVMMELPTNVRNPFSFVLGLAGTTSVVPDFDNFQSTTVGDQMFSGFALNGGRTFSADILIDGTSARAADWGGLIISPIVDSVQEMQVSRHTYDAEFGKSGGGFVSLVTKSGSNEFHGNVFEFFRGENLDANTWENNKGGIGKTEFKRHQFGGTFGGPLWSSRNLFFFAAYQGLREAQPGSSGFLTVPTELQRQGDFSQTFNPDGTLAVLYNPFSARPDAENPGQLIRDPFPNNRIPNELWDPVGARVLSLFPAPNLPGEPVTGQSNFLGTGQGKVSHDKFDTRIDWVRRPSHSLYARVSAAPRQTTFSPQLLGNGMDTNKNDENPRIHVSIGNTFTPDPTWVVNLLVGSGWWREAQVSPSIGVADASTVGLPAIFEGPAIPQFSVGGFTSLGNPQLREFTRATHTLQANLSKEMGNHSLKFGFLGESALINNIDRFSATFSFGRGMTAGPVAVTDSAETGSGAASLLLGAGAGGNAPFRTDMAASLRTYATYFQDTWRMTPKLTLTLGARYEQQRPATERFNRLSFFNPTIDNPLGDRVGLPLKGGFEFVTDDNRGLWEADNKNFAPRVGLAYQLTERVVVRAGFGIFYAPTTSLFTFDPMPGFSANTPWIASVGGGGLLPENLLSNPFPDGIAKPTGRADGVETMVGFGLDQVWLPSPHPTPYKQNFSLDLQYQPKPGSILEVGYSGSESRKLLFGQPTELNQLPSSFLSLGDELNELVPNPFFGHLPPQSPIGGPEVPRHQLMRPFPQYPWASATRSVPGAGASFHALTAKLTRQFRDGFAMVASYQFSKNIDNASEDQGWAIEDGFRDETNRRLDRSVSAHDIPHSFATTLLYELPVGKGHRFGADLPGLAEAIIGGWQVSSIVRVNSGLPMSIRQWNSVNGAFGFFPFYPNVVGDPKLSDRNPDAWFRPEAFEPSEPFTVGNAPRYMGSVRDRPMRNIDFSLMKNFVAEAYRVQLRADFFNLPNTPQYGSFSWSGTRVIESGTFGQIESVRNLPRNIQLGLKIDF